MKGDTSTTPLRAMPWVERSSSDTPPDRIDGPCAVLRGDQFYDERLVVGLLEGGPETLLGRERSDAGRGDWLAARVDGERLKQVLRLNSGRVFEICYGPCHLENSMVSARGQPQFIDG